MHVYPFLRRTFSIGCSNLESHIYSPIVFTACIIITIPYLVIVYGKNFLILLGIIIYVYQIIGTLNMIKVPVYITIIGP